jgi:4-amino-4-deoxy-L-arabinose transferase-like glycosyltransferase
MYVEQAVAFAWGTVEAAIAYPPGTSLLQAPFVVVGGWRAAVWASLLSLVIATLVIARWLRFDGYNPAFAVLFVGFAPTLVMARIASSDVPSAAIVTLGLWLFWTGDGDRWRWFLAGFLASLSLLFRPTNALLFVPFFAAAVLRRTPSGTRLAAGTIAGLGAAVLSSKFLVGTILPHGYPAGWSLHAVADSAPLYSLALLVFVPGGLLSVFAYRGRYRHELQIAVALFLAVYLFYDYSGQDSGVVERFAVTGRYLIPLMPLITIAWADCASRYVRSHEYRTAVRLAYGGVVVGSFAIHPVMNAWSASDPHIVTAIMTTVSSGLVITDDSQRKYVSSVYGPLKWLSTSDATPSTLAAIMQAHRSAHIVVVSREGTPLMPERWAPDYLYRARSHCQLELVHDRQYQTRRLQMWRVYACRTGKIDSPSLLHRSGGV